YIRLDKDRIGASRNFNDMAWVEKPNSFLKTYRAMPLNHFRNFEAQEMLEELNGKVFNNFSTEKKLGDNRVTFFEEESGIRMAVDSFTLFSGKTAEFKSNESRDTINNFLTQRSTTSSELIRNEIIDLINQSPLFSLDKMNLKIRYNLIVDGDEITTETSAKTNNQVSSCTILDNYFAYDDGTAERAIEANGIGTKIAVKFRANLKDTLRAVQFHFPRVNGDVSGQLFTLQVWIGELDPFDNVPDYQLIFKKPIYPSNFTDTLEAFTTYVLTDSMDRGIEIPAGDFYIGWQQESASTSPIPVGLDVNNPDAIENLYFNLGNKWEQFDNNSFFIPGALMLRPVMGSVTPPATSQVDEASQNANSSLSLKLFPNPAGDVLNMKLSRQSREDFRFQIFNSTGQIVKNGIFEPQISTAGLAEGMYFVKVFSNKNARVLTERFLIAR
ncbi:MAG TPA: T9SS type A sorting domain-containing protein, partial [Saprospiraceae bacterium]|nr:T9SS type A sorting domain-containing protein [Saprospiraceae bacterium]